MKSLIIILSLIMSLELRAIDRGMTYSGVIGAGTCAVAGFALAPGSTKNKSANALLFGASCGALGLLLSWMFKKDDPLNRKLKPMKLENTKREQSKKFDDDGVIELSDLGLTFNLKPSKEVIMPKLEAPNSVLEAFGGSRVIQHEIKEGSFRGTNGSVFYIPEGVKVYEYSKEIMP